VLNIFKVVEHSGPAEAILSARVVGKLEERKVLTLKQLGDACHRLNLDRTVAKKDKHVNRTEVAYRSHTPAQLKQSCQRV
jgi:hypothetical protein